MNTWIIVPAYNEVRSIQSVVVSLLPYGKVLVVDDGSSDGTWQAAKSAGALVLRHIINRGYGAALVTGSNYAVAHGAEIIVHFDADGQFEATDIPTVLKPIMQGQAEVVLGSRFLGHIQGMTTLKWSTLKLAIVFTWILSGIKLTDAHNGFRGFTSRAWSKMILNQDLMAFSSEVLDQIIETKSRFVEVPVTVRYTEYSKRGSKQGSWPALRIVRDIFLGKFIK